MDEEPKRYSMRDIQRVGVRQYWIKRVLAWICVCSVCSRRQYMRTRTTAAGRVRWKCDFRQNAMPFSAVSTSSLVFRTRYWHASKVLHVLCLTARGICNPHLIEMRGSPSLLTPRGCVAWYSVFRINPTCLCQSQFWPDFKNSWTFRRKPDPISVKMQS